MSASAASSCCYAALCITHYRLVSPSVLCAVVYLVMLGLCISLAQPDLGLLNQTLIVHLGGLSDITACNSRTESCSKYLEQKLAMKCAANVPFYAKKSPVVNSANL